LIHFFSIVVLCEQLSSISIKKCPKSYDINARYSNFYLLWNLFQSMSQKNNENDFFYLIHPQSSLKPLFFDFWMKKIKNVSFIVFVTYLILLFCVSSWHEFKYLNWINFYEIAYVHVVLIFKMIFIFLIQFPKSHDILKD
jgi:hypothetical protein